MKPLARAPSAMRHSGIREIVNLTVGVPGIIHMEIGQPDFPTPEHIVAAACAAMRDGFTRYTPSAGFPSLRELVAQKLRRVNHFKVSLEQINITPSGVNAVFTALAALVEPGDEVLIPDPAWPNYEMMMACFNSVPVRYTLDPRSGFLPDLGQVEQLVSGRTKVLIINTPSNPTGAAFPASLVRDLVRLAEEHDLWLLSDEAYDEFTYDREHASAAAVNTERVISTYTFSKTYAMTGFRIGYVAAPPEVSELINKLMEPNVTCASSISQKAAEAALSGPQDCVRVMRDSYRERRDVATGILRTHGLFLYEPQGAFYILVDVSSTGMDSYAFARALLQSEKVAVAPGGTFGPSTDGHVRVSYCVEKGLLMEGLSRLCAFIAKNHS